MRELKKYAEPLQKCAYCKFCQVSCPIYLQEIFEPDAGGARANLIEAVLLENKYPVSGRFEEIVDRCLLCTNCVQSCPAAIPIDEVVISARHQLRKGKPERVSYKLKKKFMEDRGFGALTGKLGALVSRTGILPGEFPRPADKAFSAISRKVYPAEGQKRGRVAYFVGCATNAFYPETALDVIRVFNRSGVEVIIPEGVKCCGLPALAEGDVDTAVEMAVANVSILSGLEVDAVITDCTSCGMALRTKALKLIPEADPLFWKAHALSAKIFEATDYLSKLGLASEPGAFNERYTYHVPCHRKWTPTLNDAPRLLLAQVPGAVRVEMEYPERCCGAGGTFFLDYPQLSREIKARKVEDVLGTRSSVLVTQCPACRSYLQAELKSHKVMHPLSLLARAYGF